MSDDIADILRRNSLLLFELHKKVMEERDFRSKLGKPFEIMVTFNPHTQISFDTYGTVDLYEANHERKIFGCPWFSDMGQEQPFKVWSCTK